MKNKSLEFTLVCLVIGLSGCATQQIADSKQLDAAAKAQALSSLESPQQVCKLASQAVAESRKAELEFYAPLHLKQAIKALENGRKYIQNIETESIGKQACFKANKLVAKGITVKFEVKASLNYVLEELDILRKVDVKNQFSDEIQDIVDDVINLIKRVEVGMLAVAIKQQASLVEDMRELEVEIVLHRYIKPVEAMLEKAKRAGAYVLAKRTFEQAEKEMTVARRVIKEKYRDKGKVEAASENALREARHAYYVAREVEKLQIVKPEEAEQRILYIESLLENVNKKFNDVKVVGHSLEDQSTIIAERVNGLLDKLDALNQEVARLKKGGEGIK